ncbi:TIM-barrel domain-containing protein [Pseudomonas alliivorans]|uniref:TIM-barrel domain-containing protein n=1 Tax=Pseudomonas alliivorans TaxID=2810613 RepID=UPI00338E449E
MFSPSVRVSDFRAPVSCLAMAAKARGGHAGLQRYSVLWTGDSASSWDFLRINLPQVLNLGLSPPCQGAT